MKQILHSRNLDSSPNLLSFFCHYSIPFFGFKGILRTYYFDRLRDNFYFEQFSIRKMANLYKNL